MFAVIKTGGKQYKVVADDVLKIEKLEAEAGDTITFDQVLMLSDGKETSIGSPLVEGATVVGELVEQTRGDTIKVFKKRRRQKYRRTFGHRHHFSVVKITDILAKGAKPAAKKKAAAKPAKAEEKAKAPAKEAASKDVKDDLKLISGVGPALEKKLIALGITSLKQVSEFTAEEIERVDGELNFKGRIERDEWVQQAKDLLAGKDPR